MWAQKISSWKWWRILLLFGGKRRNSTEQTSPWLTEPQISVEKHASFLYILRIGISWFSDFFFWTHGFQSLWFSVFSCFKKGSKTIIKGLNFLRCGFKSARLQSSSTTSLTKHMVLHRSGKTVSFKDEFYVCSWRPVNIRWIIY